MARKLKNRGRKLDVYCACDPPGSEGETVCSICGKLRKNNLGKVGYEGINPKAKGFKDK